MWLREKPQGHKLRSANKCLLPVSCLPVSCHHAVYIFMLVSSFFCLFSVRYEFIGVAIQVKIELLAWDMQGV